ncbi:MULTISPECIES: tetratricopeptide repeat protein [unclassified Streptomyces]|uniref:tetratricopeptide repeat protein n=1 Tax=unclassified Streptomyces TaxID=2593676 RepID=UPI0020B8CAAE|nr:tetratricopeptide repeat protein [Streptomyces sp. MAR25Y5]MCP3766798.1 tetratricopeptide repeat protein [Streptomyces sp. MAR25Y5]
MSRFSRSTNKRQKIQGERTPPPASGLRPIDVHVSADGRASVGGLQVTPGPDENLQDAVLNHLHRLVLATGHPVAATVHDERIGFSTSIQVVADGSSSFAAEPVRLAARAAVEGKAEAPAATAGAVPPGTSGVHAEPVTQGAGEASPAREAPDAMTRMRSEALAVDGASEVSMTHGAGEPFMTRGMPEASVTPDALPLAAVPSPPPLRDKATRLLRAVPEPAPVQAVPEPAPVQEVPAAERPAPVDQPGSVAASTGAMAPSLLAEPVWRINEAVRMGRIESAAAMAEQAIGSAAQTLGMEHPEVLQLRELAAYIAYLAGDGRRSFALSMGLARARRRQDSARAFDNVQSAAAAWRTLRDPVLGLSLGNQLVALWSDMAAEGGPAAADPAQLDSVRARMGRLAERAGALSDHRAQDR